MTDKELMQKRVLPALQQLYLEADNWFNCGNFPNFSINWEKINAIVKYIKAENPKYDARFILESFYIPEERQKEILKKATANLRHYWRWPYKSQIIYTPAQIKEMKAELAKYKEDDFEYKHLKEKIDNNSRYKKQDKLWKEYFKQLTALSEQLENKEITRKEYNKKEEELAKSYGCTLRSRDAEVVYFEIWNYAPTNSKEKYDRYKAIWEFIISTKTLKNEEIVERLVDEYFEKQKIAQGITDNKMDAREFEELKNVQQYMREAWTFIENYYKLYGDK